MIRLKIKSGKWKDEQITREMILEVCTGKCVNRELHYPFYMDDVHCPDCKTDLIGGKLVKAQKRKEWHLTK